jgi:histidine ammonia-lyase
VQVVPLDGHKLTVEAVVGVSRSRAVARLDDQARERMTRSAAWVGAAAAGEIRGEDGQPLPVYGVNTGYGSLARVRIAPEAISALSWNLVRSHAAGVGPRIPDDQVRAMMVLRANALAKGVSGCRPALVDTLCRMLEHGIVPEVPSRGSCGSSGDLAPLAHLGLVVFAGEGDDAGWVWVGGERLPADVAMARAGIPRLAPGPKEGLAMTNGAQLTTGIAALVVGDGEELLHLAEVALALSFEALLGTSRALHPAVQALRPYPGAIACAAHVRRLLAGSALVDSVPDKVQDPYSLRCAPQVHGAARDAFSYGRRQVEVEINAATDNPLILVDEPDANKAFSAGLFHGEPVGFACDHLRLALCELASISERRTFRLTTPHLSLGLPASLVEGDDVGVGAAQSAAAALVATARQLAFPSSADTVPTCEDQEDHTAMSTTAARRAWEVLEHARTVVAIELLCAARGVLLRGSRPGEGTAAALDVLRPLVDRPEPAEAIAAVRESLVDGSLLAAVQRW